jgi:hypothetical protein
VLTPLDLTLCNAAAAVVLIGMSDGTLALGAARHLGPIRVALLGRIFLAEPLRGLA